MEFIRVEQRGFALWVTFCWPEKANALQADDLAELQDLIARIPDDVAALVFTGEGTRAFSSGMNVATFANLDRTAAETFITQLAAVMASIRHSSVVSVAAINGVCLGGAFELALACDLRVVSRTASFGLPEVKVGIPSVIDAALLPGFVGLSRAREMILTGDIYRLDQLPTFSLANLVVEPDELVERDAVVTRPSSRPYAHCHRRAATPFRHLAEPSARRLDPGQYHRIRRRV